MKTTKAILASYVSSLVEFGLVCAKTQLYSLQLRFYMMQQREILSFVPQLCCAS